MRDRLFFFQAEDGIRDRDVTGVQTCALPICPAGSSTMMDVITGKTRPDEGTVFFDGTVDLTRLDEAAIANLGRSEERRVGKEGRFRRLRFSDYKIRFVRGASDLMT